MPTQHKPIGTVGNMPGTDGFTMAAFVAKDVPAGSQLYSHQTVVELKQQRDELLETIKQAEQMLDHGQKLHAQNILLGAIANMESK